MFECFVRLEFGGSVFYGVNGVSPICCLDYFRKVEQFLLAGQVSGCCRGGGVRVMQSIKPDSVTDFGLLAEWNGFSRVSIFRILLSALQYYIVWKVVYGKRR